MPFIDSAFHDSTGCNSSPASMSVLEGFTPNKRLNSWAETRNLSIDTDSILARADEREREKQRRLEEERRRAERKRKYHDGDSKSTRSGTSGKSQVVFGCFSFLPMCRRGF